MAEQFHWDLFFSGLVLSSFWFGYALTQIIGGKLDDEMGSITINNNSYIIRCW